MPYVQVFENATASLFHTFTVQAIQGYRECFARTSIRHCAYNASLFSNAVVSCLLCDIVVAAVTIMVVLAMRHCRCCSYRDVLCLLCVCVIAAVTMVVVLVCTTLPLLCVTMMLVVA